MSSKARQPRERPESARPGLTMKASVVVGFGLTVGIWMFAGYYFGQRVADLEHRSADVSARYLHAQDLLTTARSQVLLSSVYVRDALIDLDPKSSATYRHEMERSFDRAEVALQEYQPVLDSRSERDRVQRLRGEIAHLHTTMLDVLSADANQWPVDAGTLLRSRIMPQREAATQIAEELLTLNRNAFVQHQNEIADIYRTTQRRVWEILGLALLASLGIGLLAVLYAGRLQEQIRRQLAQDALKTRDLQRLSAQLINAQEDERRHIARELHDEVGQVLTAIKVELKMAQRALDAAGAPSDVLQESRSIADRALHTVRDLSHLLHPALLDDLGLPSAVDWYVKGFRRRHGLRLELVLNDVEQRLAPDIEVAAYRIIQEALTNVAKHSQATECTVRLRQRDDKLLIEIEDNGIGFVVPGAGRASTRRGLGLIGIRERAAQVGGTIRLESTPGAGTRVGVELPARVPAVIPEPESAGPSPVVVQPAS